MSTPMALLAQGSYISDGNVRSIEFPHEIDYFVVRDRTLWGTAPTAVVESKWARGFAPLAAQCLVEGAASALSASAAPTNNGFIWIDSTNPPYPGPVAITAITNANPAVLSAANTFPVGMILRPYGTTQMLQIAGIPFEITAETPGVDMTLGYLNAAGFANPANAGFFRVIGNDYYAPRMRYITAITLAVNAVVTTSVSHNYQVGDKVVLHIPNNFGMIEANNVLVTITAITAGTFTTDMNSTAFNAFAFPTSAVAAAGTSFAHVTPVGEVSTILTAATHNEGNFGLYLGVDVCGANLSVMDWWAFSRDYTI